MDELIADLYAKTVAMSIKHAYAFLRSARDGGQMREELCETATTLAKLSDAQQQAVAEALSFASTYSIFSLLSMIENYDEDGLEAPEMRIGVLERSDDGNYAHLPTSTTSALTSLFRKYSKSPEAKQVLSTIDRTV